MPDTKCATPECWAHKSLKNGLTQICGSDTTKCATPECWAYTSVKNRLTKCLRLACSTCGCYHHITGQSFMCKSLAQPCRSISMQYDCALLLYV